VFTRARHWSLSLAIYIQFISLHSVYFSSVLVLSSHLRLDLIGSLFPSGFPTEMFYVLFISPMRAVCCIHPILLDFIILITFGEAYKL
jgi:hypothetical protein